MATFGEHLQQHGKSAAYKALLQKQGISRHTTERWERGESEPAPWLATAIATALRVDRDVLFPRQHDDNSRPEYNVHRRHRNAPLVCTRVDRANSK